VTRVVWSFWTKPYEWQFRSRWVSDKQHLLAWILSVETARRHYPDTSLYTDDEGAAMLVDGLGLRFRHVSLALNALADRDPRWWCLGKAYTYRLQRAPFIHLDNDVILWKPLPPVMERAAVIAQNPEYFSDGVFHYRPEAVDWVIKGIHDGWLPREWEWYRAFGQDQRGECCGILGGANVAFIRHYAAQVIKLVEDPRNAAAWTLFDKELNRNVHVEQYLLSACVEYHRSRAHSPFHRVETAYVFPSSHAAYDPDLAERAGYTHLMGNIKLNPKLNDRLEARVKRDYPGHYERCLAWLERREVAANLEAHLSAD
jgi:hypothetical protein